MRRIHSSLPFRAGTGHQYRGIPCDRYRRTRPASVSPRRHCTPRHRRPSGHSNAVPQPRRYQTPHCGDQYRRSMTSPRYCPMHGPEKQPESKRPGTCPPWSVCVPTTAASPQSISRVAMCPSISRRPVCPPDRWSISVPGRHPADRQSPGAEGSAIDIGYMASGLISMPARACASSDIGAIPRAYVPADIAGCRHTLRYRIRIIEHGYNKSIELP